MKQPHTFFILMIICLAATPCYAQRDSLAKNSVYGELLGSGDLYSVNFERLFKPQQSVRLGFALFPENWYEGGKSEKTIMNIPLSYQYFFGQLHHHIETSAGVISSFTISPNQPTQCLVYPNIAAGYRYQQKKGGWYLGCKVYLMIPAYLSIDKDDVLLYSGKSFYLTPGISAGWSF